METKALSPDDPRVRTPLFTIAEAAEYLGVAYTTLRRWARPEFRKVPLVPLITVFPAEGHGATMPFVGFAEAFVIVAAKRAGVPDWRIRPGVEGVKKEFGDIDHALAHRLLFTDGAEILIGKASDNLEVARNRQRQMTDTVRSQLELITYASDDQFAERIQLPAYGGSTVVLVDPKVAFGYPFVKSGGARVKDILDRFQGEERISDIALDFGLTTAEVEDVIRVRAKAAA